MSLFYKLNRLTSGSINRLEDFNTEIVAEILQNSPELTVKWLTKLDLTDSDQFDDVIVKTQEVLPALNSHDGRDSRPDISIRIVRNNFTELIYLESKIGSREIEGKDKMPSQLKRYADHLSARIDLSKRSLIYITRDFEPKEDPQIPNVKFLQLRWYDFYRFFNNERKSSDLITEQLSFMEENNMSQNNQFTTVDILALSNFQRVRKIMDATMWDSVAKRFSDVCGNISRQKECITQFRDFNRYVMYAEYGQGGQFFILLGYFMVDDSLTGYSDVGLTMQVNPKSLARNQIVVAMRDYEKIKGGSWKCDGLENEREWGAFRNRKSLRDFLSTEDHVKAISNFFAQLLTDVEEFKKSYPNLPWTAQQMTKDEQS